MSLNSIVICTGFIFRKPGLHGSARLSTTSARKLNPARITVALVGVLRSIRLRGLHHNCHSLPDLLTMT